MYIYQPYTYLIGWSKLDYWYYGCQYGKNHANPNNLWTTYFTSSDYVFNMRQYHGEPDVVEIRRVFQTREQTLRCEEKVLTKVGAVKSPRWLNRSNAGKVTFMGKKHSKETITKIRQYRLGKTFSPATLEKMRQAKLGRKQSQDHIEKRRQAHIGRKNTFETREKMRQSALRRFI